MSDSVRPFVGTPEEAKSRTTLFGPIEADSELVAEAAALVVAARRASASYLQRRLRVGFGEAVELLDALREQGLVDGTLGDPNGRVVAQVRGAAPGEAEGEAAD